MRTNRRYALGAAVLALATMVAACSKSGGGGTTKTSGPPKGSISVGVSGNFAENQIIASMYAQVLQKAGYTVTTHLDFTTRDISNAALFSAQIDVKPEYLAYMLLKLDPNATDTTDPAAAAAALKPLLQAKSINLLNYSQANDTNSFVVTQETATMYNLTTMSSLAPVAGQLTLGAPPDCKTNALCIPGLMTTYGITFKEYKSLDLGGPKTVAAVKSGAVQVGELFSTDAAISANHFVILQDDKMLQAAGQIAPIIRASKDNAEIDGLLNAVTAKLTDANVSELVAKVSIDQEDPEMVAKDFLTANGLL
jgi:osmoprotectant transport system substrate-binding protein